jgi:CRISPR/Cas system-associated exonuclease Cas4 (RecB family)
MRTLRASEIGAFLYCQRAWWYQRQGKPSENTVEMAAGIQIHHRHGQEVVKIGIIRLAAAVLLLAALALVTIYGMEKFLN